MRAVLSEIKSDIKNKNNNNNDNKTEDMKPLSLEKSEPAARIESWLKAEGLRRKVFDKDGLIEAVEEQGGGRFEYTYNNKGDLSEIIEANGSRITYEYDEKRRLIRVGHPDGTVTLYAYGTNDRLVRINDRGIVSRFEHDPSGRITKIFRGNAGASVYRYDEKGRNIMARTSAVSTEQEFDDSGRIIAIRQTLNGVSISVGLGYDQQGRLAKMLLPGSASPVNYQWDHKGRPERVSLGNWALAEFEYLDEDRIARISFSNGVTEETKADHTDGRPISLSVTANEKPLLKREYAYGSTGEILSDGARRYDYDQLGRMTYAEDLSGGSKWRFGYDNMDNRVFKEDNNGILGFGYDPGNLLVEIAQKGGGNIRISYDGFGRPIVNSGPEGQRTYRYNDSGDLLQVLYRGNRVASFTYDHKGRIVMAGFAGRTERYLYGPDDELLAVTGENGEPLRLYIRTPLGVLAEIRGPVDSGGVYCLHSDFRGTCHLVTDREGRVISEFLYTPFGIPIYTDSGFLPIFSGRIWNPETGMYSFGARWYNPALGRFLTPDTYTAAPDDERIIHPLWPSGRQVLSRSGILGDWLRHPRRRNLYAYCGNDPLNRSDPNGRWSFGGVLLSVLGAIWTLPNTLFGLIVEITCLVGEVIRWLVWLVTGGNVTWKTPGFDAAASGRLNAFALVFKGGWLGSIPGLMGITFGNVFFVYKDWEEDPDFGGPGNVSPSAYGGRVSFPRKEALYEHELRHTNQYDWFGPFFHLGLPIFGVYEWDVILNGYRNAWLERDARDHAGV